jgi:hypothetical protein
MTAQERQLALNEAKVLSLLSHPNIIRYCLHTTHTVVTRVDCIVQKQKHNKVLKL